MKISIKVAQDGEVTEGTLELLRHAVNLAYDFTRASAATSSDAPREALVEIDSPFGKAVVKAGE